MKILFTFPGQGTQHPGMLQQLPGTTLAEAREVLGAEVDTLDTPEALEHTRAVQLSLLIDRRCSLGARTEAAGRGAGYRQRPVDWRVPGGSSGRCAGL